MKSINNSIPVLLIAILFVGIIFLFKDGQIAVGSTIDLGPFLQQATTSASVSVTTSTRLMASTSNPLDPANQWTRIYSTICNPNANPVYIALDADQPATLGNSTYVIAAAAGYNACYEINDQNPYNGSVTASSTNQTATVINYMQYVR